LDPNQSPPPGFPPAWQDWFTSPGEQTSVVGFDGDGNAIIYANDPGQEKIWVPAGSDWTLIITSFRLSGAPVADGHGIWFSGVYNNGTVIALFVAGSGMYQMANFDGQLAGGCD
jgi:hypothetical protein